MRKRNVETIFCSLLTVFTTTTTIRKYNAACNSLKKRTNVMFFLFQIRACYYYFSEVLTLIGSTLLFGEDKTSDWIFSGVSDLTLSAKDFPDPIFSFSTFVKSIEEGFCITPIPGFLGAAGFGWIGGFGRLGGFPGLAAFLSISLEQEIASLLEYSWNKICIVLLKGSLNVIKLYVIRQKMLANQVIKSSPKISG